MRQQFRDLVNRLDAELPSDVPFRFVSQVRRDGAFLEELSKLPLRRPVSFHDVSGNIDLCMVQY
ncbi:hypothetical protein, partial [Halomonas marinisediminis]|uniref:hypothetical protein n=1 Tax=Halomonas marinisediminis TaxID=2546095 RepID=UPI001F0D52FA